MTEDNARRTANIIMAAGTVAAAFYVLKEPRLRRLAWQLARGWATGPLVAWSAAELRRAWDASADGDLAHRHARARPESTRGRAVRTGAA